jgi:hypothetical protein
MNLDDIDPRVREIGYNAIYAPRSIAGKYHRDPLMHVILYTQAELKEEGKKISFVSFISAFLAIVEGDADEDKDRLSVAFKSFAERLEYLETPRTPTAGDFAVDALQDAFMGLTKSQHQWGKKGFPSKGEVTQMAKASLAGSGRNVRKAGWTALLREAGLDWLPKGDAGRPSKANLDANAKAAREIRAIITEAEKSIYKGDSIRFRDNLRSALGGKTEYQRSEQDRLSSPPENESHDEVLE